MKTVEINFKTVNEKIDGSLYTNKELTDVELFICDFLTILCKKDQLHKIINIEKLKTLKKGDLFYIDGVEVIINYVYWEDNNEIQE